jgi:hypothetical protein
MLELSCHPAVFFKLLQAVSNSLLVRFKGISDLAIELAKPKNAFLP